MNDNYMKNELLKTDMELVRAYLNKNIKSIDLETKISDFINEHFDDEDEADIKESKTFGIRNEDSFYIECSICSKGFELGETFITDVKIDDYDFGYEKYILCEKCHKKVIEAYQGKIEF